MLENFLWGCKTSFLRADLREDSRFPCPHPGSLPQRARWRFRPGHRGELGPSKRIDGEASSKSVSVSVSVSVSKSVSMAPVIRPGIFSNNTATTPLPPNRPIVHTPLGHSSTHNGPPTSHGAARPRAAARERVLRNSPPKP